MSLDALYRQPFGFRTCGNDDGDLPQPLLQEGSCTEDGFLADESNIRMREDALDTSTKLRYHLSHSFTSLSEGC